MEDIVDVLQKCGNSLDAVCQLARNRIQVHPAGLLKISELRDFETVEENLPANAPCAERRRFPIVFFEPDIVLLQVDSDEAQAVQINVLHVGWRRFKYHLKLSVFVQAVGILAISSIGGAPTGLNVSDAVWIRSEDAKKGLGVHRARADFHVVGLLEDATAARPILLQAENEALKRRAFRSRGRSPRLFILRHQRAVSSISRETSLRSI